MALGCRLPLTDNGLPVEVGRIRRLGFEPPLDNFRIVASLDRKRLGRDTSGWKKKSTRGVFDKETRRKPLAFAADAARYGISTAAWI
jgi:hypothetical protein